jgi:hypothetical protein
LYFIGRGGDFRPVEDWLQLHRDRVCDAAASTRKSEEKSFQVDRGRSCHQQVGFPRLHLFSQT